MTAPPGGHTQRSGTGDRSGSLSPGEFLLHHAEAAPASSSPDLRREVDYHSVETDGGRRAADLLAELL